MKLLALFFLMIFPTLAIACPGCVGSDGGMKDLYVVYVIMGFILLVYIPFFLLYRMIIKNNKAHMIGREESVETVEASSIK